MNHRSLKAHIKYGEKTLDNLRDKYFLKPDGSNFNIVVQSVELALLSLIKKQGKGPTYLSSTQFLGHRFDIIYRGQSDVCVLWLTGFS